MMKTLPIINLVILCAAIWMDFSPEAQAQSVLPQPVDLLVSSPTGKVRALKFTSTIPRLSDVDRITTIYIPASGLAWTGSLMEDHQAALEDRMFGFCYFGGDAEKLLVSFSTNRYEANANDLPAIMHEELESYKSGRGRFGGTPWGRPYFVVLVDTLLGPTVLHDRIMPPMDGVPDINTLAIASRPSKFQGVTVEGTNVVVTIEIGTNMLAKIAFDKEVRPVWATTNGVSIGPIRTNTVYLIVLEDSREKMMVVH